MKSEPEDYDETVIEFWELICFAILGALACKVIAVAIETAAVFIISS